MTIALPSVPGKIGSMLMLMEKLNGPDTGPCGIPGMTDAGGWPFSVQPVLWNMREGN